MCCKRFTEEFKAGAVKQVTERRHPAAEVAVRLGYRPGACTGGSKNKANRSSSVRQAGTRQRSCARCELSSSG
jgi:transposase-like protein